MSNSENNISSDKNKIFSLIILLLFLFILLSILWKVFHGEWAVVILIGLFSIGLFQVLLKLLHNIIYKWVEPPVVFLLKQSLIFFRIHKYKHFWQLYTLIVTILLVLVLFHSKSLTFASDSLHDTFCVKSDLFSNKVVESFSKEKNELYNTFCGNGLDDVLTLVKQDTDVKVGLVAPKKEYQVQAIFENNSAEEAILEELLAKQNQEHNACTTKHITLAIATTLSSTETDSNISESMGIANLRGAAIAQKAYNDNPAHKTKVCLIIANLGTRSVKEDQLKFMLNKLIRYSKYDLTFRGIVGMPYSKHAEIFVSDSDWQRNAERVPIVSSAAMSNALNIIDTYKHVPESKQYFHRVVKQNDYQAEHIIDFVKHTFPDKKSVILQGGDAYTQDLGNQFYKLFNKEQYTYIEENDELLKKAIKKALEKDVEVFLFAGYAFDLENFENTLKDARKTIPIIGGQGIYGLYSGDDSYKHINPVAPIYSAIYAGPIDKDDPFYNLYQEAFPSEVIDMGSYAFLPTHAVLSQEATYVFLDATEKLERETNEVPSRTALNAKIATLQVAGPKYNGNPDTIQFAKGDSSPLAKSDYIVCIGTSGQVRLVAVYVPGSEPHYYDTSVCQ